MRRIALRLAGQQAEESVILAAKTIRGVALGIGFTALIQSLVGGIGFAVTGVPFPGLLAAIIFILALAQLPPFLVMVPAVIWLYWKGDPVWGTVLLVWTILVSSIDNILRPLLIRKGVDLPLLLIFTGVHRRSRRLRHHRAFHRPGGARRTYKLLEAWIGGDEKEPTPTAAVTPIQPIEAGDKED